MKAKMQDNRSEIFFTAEGNNMLLRFAGGFMYYFSSMSNIDYAWLSERNMKYGRDHIQLRYNWDLL